MHSRRSRHKEDGERRYPPLKTWTNAAECEEKQSLALAVHVNVELPFCLFAYSDCLRVFDIVRHGAIKMFALAWDDHIAPTMFLFCFYFKKCSVL